MAKQLNLFDITNQPDYLIYTEVFPETESDEIEYKSAAGGFPKDFWKTYSAFGNTSGGIIVLGVKEKDGIFIFDGLTAAQIEKYKKEFWNNANNPSTVSYNLLTNADVKEFLLDDKRVLAFNIPVAERKHKPVYLTTNPFRNTYKRNHEGDYVCRDEEVRRLLADADLSFSPDSRILEGYSFDDIDATSLKQYRQLLASVKPSHPWLTLDDIGFLEQLGGYRKDRKSKKEGFTVAGMLMFGKYQSITDEECCPTFFPDYREILSEQEEMRWSDRIYPDGTWECNLFQFYKVVYPKLSSRLPKPFQLVKGQRIDETPAHTSLREAFVNALIHADYAAPGSIIIESHAESFTFTNPGTLLVTLHQFYKGGVSECRNRKLQSMFLLIGSAEKAGSGVSKILSGWLSAHWRRPYVITEAQPDRVILQMPMFSIIPEDTLLQLKALFGDSVEALRKEELAALAICQIEGETSNSKLQYHVNLHRSDITKLLQHLCKKGFLVSENKNRWTNYRLNTDFSSQVDTSNEDTSDVDGSNVDGSNVDGSNVDGSNVDGSNVDGSNVDGSDVDGSDVDGSDVDGSDVDGSDVDGSDVDTSLNEDASNSDIKRKEKTSLQIQIIEACQTEYISAEEIAAKVGRSEKYLKNRIIPEMLKYGYLVKLHPQKYHPYQRYISKN